MSFKSWTPRPIRNVEAFAATNSNLNDRGTANDRLGPQSALHSLVRSRKYLRAQVPLPNRHRIKWSMMTLVIFSITIYLVASTGKASEIESSREKDGTSTNGASEAAALTIPVTNVQQPSKPIQMAQVDVENVPHLLQETSGVYSRRLLFIGDIHGCFEEFMQLLHKADYDEARDHIITTGDMINKGPKSEAVIDFLISKQASCVRGNHDNRILLMAAQARTQSTIQDEAGNAEEKLARSLTDSQISYLESCPLVLQVGAFPSYGNLVVVHGGLVPSLALSEQDPWAIMNMRVIDPSSHVPFHEFEREGCVPWAEFWNQRQLQAATEQMLDIEDRHEPTLVQVGVTVVFGHDAQRGLQARKYTKGLDTGCVYGRQLTALVLSSNGEEEFLQVECTKYA